MSHETDGRIFVFILILISFIILWEKHVKCISSSVFALGMGMSISFLWKTASASAFDFTPEIFLYLLLPPMLLFSSFSFEFNSLKKNWVASLTFASLGTLFSMTWIACGILVWTRYQSIEMSVARAFLFASVLAPTDTVATMSMTRSLQIRDKYLFEVLENESIMNDALSVVLVRLFKFMDDSEQSIDRWTPLAIVFWSLLTTSLSISGGIVVARAINRANTDSLTIHYLCALMVYGLCEIVGLSGILGLFTYGAALNPPKTFRESVSSFSTIIEAYVYLTLGLALHTYNWANFQTSVLVFVSCIVGRVLTTFVFGTCFSVRDSRWSRKSMLFFSMCGVRGAISYALSMSLQNEFIRSTTFVVIVCTIFVFGTFQKCLLRILLI